MKKIYIAHEYDTKSHFEALYKCANEYGYEIAWYHHIMGYLLKRTVIKLVKTRSIRQAFMYFCKSISYRIAFHRLHDEILIVGIAPYNHLMHKYRKIFLRNKSIYFTSFNYWEIVGGGVCPVKRYS